jgi:predicted secreted protein
MRIFRLLALLALSFLPLAAAHAETLLNLSETRSVSVRPDQITATLRAEATAGTAAGVQQQVNAMMTAAVARARQTQGVVVTTGGYNVWRSTPPAQSVPPHRAASWQASQTLELRGGDGAAMLELVDALQQSGLATAGLAWGLAPETVRLARRQATELAVKALRGRAEDVAALLGMRFVAFKEVRLDGDRSTPMPRVMALSASRAMGAAPPIAEAENVTVEAVVEAEAVLSPP